MNESVEANAAPVDIGAYCREVEEHLTRVNGGQLIRVVGPAFEMVRGWVIEGIPLSVAMRGIELKAERHRAGRSRRPLRLEFCEADVRDVYEQWRRSVGLGAGGAAEGASDTGHEPAKRPSLTRHLNRVVEQLARAAGRLDLSETFRDDLTRLIDSVAAMAEAARSARGEGRAEIAARLPALDAALIEAARTAAGAEVLMAFRADAERDVSAYRSRLAPDVWQRSVDLGVDRMLRRHLGLPTLTFEH